MAHRHVLVALCLILGFGCQQELSPAQVSQRFWKAVEAQDAGAVRLFVTRESLDLIHSSDKILPISDFKLGRTLIDGTTARVETTVTVSSDKPVPIPLDTYLVHEDGRWKVDYRRSVGSLSAQGELADLLARLHAFNDEFSRKMDDSIEDLQRALPEIEREVRRFEDSLHKQIPELKKQLEDFARRLEEALKRPESEQAEQKPQPIAI